MSLTLRAVLASASALSVLFAVFLLSSYSTSSVQSNKNEECARIESRGDRYPCYMRIVHDIIVSEGIDAGFAYAKDIRPSLDYQTNHMIMHEVGRTAYAELGDLGRALMYLSENSGADTFDFELDGYRHGLFETFFANNSSRSAQELVQEGCAAYMSIEREQNVPLDVYDLSPKEVTRSEHDANQCFHGIGHALMYANGNDIHRSLNLCDEMPEKWQRDWCYYGAYMQYTFNFWPSYVPDTPKPVESESMATLCNSSTESQQYACAHLVGRAYLNMHAADGNAFDSLLECSKINPRYHSACIVETAAFALPFPFRSTPDKMFAQCMKLEKGVQAACVYGAASGIRQGAGGEQNRNSDVCSFVEPQFKELCDSATGRGYTLRF